MSYEENWLETEATNDEENIFDTDDFNGESSEGNEQDWVQGDNWDTGDGRLFNSIEADIWHSMLNHAIEQGHDAEVAYQCMNEVLCNTVIENDTREFEKLVAQGKYNINDVTPEVWNVYINNLGKRDIADVVEEFNNKNDDFLSGFNQDKTIKHNSKGRSVARDQFLEGFNDYNY